MPINCLGATSYRRRQLYKSLSSPGSSDGWLYDFHEIFHFARTLRFNQTTLTVHKSLHRYLFKPVKYEINKCHCSKVLSHWFIAFLHLAALYPPLYNHPLEECSNNIASAITMCCPHGMALKVVALLVYQYTKCATCYHHDRGCMF